MRAANKKQKTPNSDVSESLQLKCKIKNKSLRNKDKKQFVIKFVKAGQQTK